MSAYWNLPPGCTPQDIDDAMGPDKCEHCDGNGFTVTGETDEPEQVQCEYCYGTGNAPTRAELRAKREEEKADRALDDAKDREAEERP